MEPVLRRLLVGAGHRPLSVSPQGVKRNVIQMKLYVKLYATLARSVSESLLAQHPEGLRAGSRLEVELPEGSTLADLVDYLALPRKEIKVLFVNARSHDFDYRLESGDEVGIFPPIGGG